ncbi:hypothetical protein D3C72_2376790 [compost metagenome]
MFLNLHILNQPEVFANAFSASFDSDGNLVDAAIQEKIRKQLAALQAWHRQLKG